MVSIRLPLWLRVVLLGGVVVLTTGASLFAYRYFTRPVTLSVAVGSIDGEAAKAMSAIASRLVSTNAPVRLNVVDSGTAFLPVHPGAAAFYNGTQQSFMDKYGNEIYLTPMVLGGAATVLAAAWKFLRIGNSAAQEGPLDSLYALARRIRKVDSEAELLDIEEEIDSILKAERARSASGDEKAVDDATLNVASHRLESLIHDRRTMLARRPAVVSAA